MIGNAAFTLIVVPENDLVPNNFAACGFSLCAGIGGHDNIRFVIKNAFLRKLLITLYL